MKRLLAILSGLVILPAQAELPPSYFYEDMASYADMIEEGDTEEFEQGGDDTLTAPAPEPQVTAPVAPAAVSSRSTSPRTSSRAMAAGNSGTVGARRGASGTTSTRTTVPRGVASRTATVTATSPRAVSSQSVSARPATASRGTAARATVARPTSTARSATTAGTGPSVSASASKSVSGTAARSATASGTSTGARAAVATGLIQTDTVNTPLYTGRGVASRRSVTARSTPTITTAGLVQEEEEPVATTTQEMQELIELTDYCKTQYSACMDNFCNVLDDNQGRCSCSVNLKKYEKTEAALKQATSDLQDVAQKIQYIGLSSQDMETLFTQTEAELTMQSKSDNSAIKNDLDKIKDMIVEIQTPRASSSGSGFDMNGLFNVSFSSSGFDFGSILGTSSNTKTISNQRGEDLYKSASARCKASVLDSCTAQGVDSSIVINAYELEIDKACIAYERSLTEANTQMSSTVRNAKNVLQQARLMVERQKNEYNLRECVNELDNCMQDDFVCGADYEGCLDPTGKYIVNGKVVVGSTPGKVGEYKGESGTYLYDIWTADSTNPFSTSSTGSTGNMAEYIDTAMKGQGSDSKSSTSNDIATFLIGRIGKHDDTENRDSGMCMYVLNKCQNYTYSGMGSDRTYNAQNSVIKEYLSRTLTQIRAAQDEVLSEYSEDCNSNIAACLSQSNITKESCKPAANACRAMIKTCTSISGTDVSTEEKLGAFIKAIEGSTFECKDLTATTNW